MSRRSTYLGLGVVILGAATAVVVFLIVNSLSQDNGDQTNEIVQLTERSEGETRAPPMLTTVLTAESGSGSGLDSTTIDSFQATNGPTSIFTQTPTSSDRTPQTPVIPSPTEIINHQVVEGENLYRIAALYGISLESIMIANDLEDPRLIITGQTLLIPGGAPITLQIDNGLANLITVTAAIDIAEATAQGSATAPIATSEGPNRSTQTATSTVPNEDTPTSTAQPVSTLNGIAIEQIVFMPDDVKQRTKEIFTVGQDLGRNPQRFSKVGDSTIENPHFLARFDEGPYKLGIYSYLQPTIDFFEGSFGRQGNAVKRGFHSWTVMDPMWADDTICEPNETPIDCEIRLHNPSILLIRLGSNDRGVPAGFDQNVRQLVEHAIEQGIIPVIGTKADRFEGEDNINNILLRQIATDYKLPLWDFDLVAGTIPGRGLYIDDVHLTIYYAHDYTSPVALQRGHGVHNLTALMVLDAIRKEVIQAGG